MNKYRVKVITEDGVDKYMILQKRVLGLWWKDMYFPVGYCYPISKEFIAEPLTCRKYFRYYDNHKVNDIIQWIETKGKLKHSIVFNIVGDNFYFALCGQYIVDDLEDAFKLEMILVEKFELSRKIKTKKKDKRYVSIDEITKTKQTCKSIE